MTLRRVPDSCADDVLEPLPVNDEGVPVPPAPVAGDWLRELSAPANAGRRYSSAFIRTTALNPALLADLPNWWCRQADNARVRVSTRLLLEAPRFEPSGTWRLRGSLRSPWLRRWIPVELQLWPRLGAWTKLSLEPRRFVRPGRRYFNNGHRTLDDLTSRLTSELNG
jgi:hypothetical protein